jgi:hypothetical protein
MVHALWFKIYDWYFAQEPGLGGSLDSGPATSPETDGDAFSTLLYILFFVVLPLLVVVLCLVYYARGRFLGAAGGFKKRSGTAAAEEEDGFIRIERRPPSRLNLAAKDISRPLSVVTTTAGNSLASSPTHALLPHSTTVTSDMESTGI